MVTNFLDLERPFVLHPMFLKADLALEEVRSLNTPLFNDRGISVERDYCDPIPVVEIDIAKMKSCFQNLIANAVEAMPHGGTLRTVIMESAGWVQLRFEDSGEGIRPENLPKLFEPYFTTNRKGIGLGLAIARRVIESHQNSIDVTSSVGGGTRVTISLSGAAGRPSWNGSTQSVITHTSLLFSRLGTIESAVNAIKNGAPGLKRMPPPEP